jgi:hypothetical protein
MLDSSQETVSILMLDSSQETVSILMLNSSSVPQFFSPHAALERFAEAATT